MFECIAHEEEERLRALVDLDILDSMPEQVFDDFTWLAKEIAEVPICLISLVDSERQWFKSKQGLEIDETPRNISFCSLAISKDVPMIVEDAAKDPHFKDYPMVIGGIEIRFYLGIPLRTKRGFRIGTLCLIDKKPRQLSEATMEKIQVIANRIMHEIETRRMRLKQKRLLEEDMGVRSLNDETGDSLFPCIRQPLAAILDSTSFMLETAHFQADQKSDLLAIHNTTRQLFQFFDAMLLDPKSGCYVTQNRVETVDIRECIATVQQMFSVIFKHRKVNLCIQVCDSVPQHLEIEPLSFKQILMVLIDEVFSTLSSRIHLCVEIPNTYQSPHLLNVVIKPETAQNSEKEIAKPISFLTPIGGDRLRDLRLKFLKKKLNILGGFLVLPRLGQPATTAMIPVVLMDQPQQQSEPWLHLSVVYVTRDPVSEVMVSRYLTQLGHKTTITTSLEQLLSEFLDNSYDCIILDSSIELETAQTIVEKINFIQGDLKIKVPFMGLVGDLQCKHQFEQLGMQQVLLKPLEKDSLQASLFANV